MAGIAFPSGFLHAEEQKLDELLPIKFELPLSPVREEALKLLKPEQWFKTLEQYIKVPLPGTGVKDIEVNREKVSELNIEIGRETGVDLVKFFQFVGKILVIVFEGIARLIRGFI